MPPGPTSSKTEHVHPVGTETNIYVKAYTRVLVGAHTDQDSRTGTVHTNTNTKSSNGLILLISMADQDDGLLVGLFIHIKVILYIYI